MDQVTLPSQSRVANGSRASRRLRREGLVPAVVYGRGHDPVSVSVDGKELYRALHTEAGANALINLELSGGDTLLTVAREVQRHPVGGQITHLDFIQVSLDTEIEADVAIDFQGDPIGVREDGGIVETIEATVPIEALPTAIPSSIEIDISELRIGDTLRVADLPEIEGVVYLLDAESPIMTVAAPRLEIEEPEEGELEEGELEEGELEEGDAEAAAADEGDEG